MSIKGYISKAENIRNWYRPGKLESAIQYANKYREIEGVEEIIEIFEEKLEGYKRDIGELINKECATVDEKGMAYEKAQERSNIFIWLLKKSLLGIPVSFAACIVWMFVHIVEIPRVISDIGAAIVVIALILCIVASIVFGILRIVYKMEENSVYKAYSKYITPLYNQMNEIERRYFSNISSLENEVDDLYLNSLEPTHRIAVLMRREQQQYNQQLIRLQEQQKRQQEEHQKLVEEEQRRIRQAQEELLAIEREREARYRRY